MSHQRQDIQRGRSISSTSYCIGQRQAQKAPRISTQMNASCPHVSAGAVGRTQFEPLPCQGLFLRRILEFLLYRSICKATEYVIPKHTWSLFRAAKLSCEAVPKFRPRKEHLLLRSEAKGRLLSSTRCIAASKHASSSAFGWDSVTHQKVFLNSRYWGSKKPMRQPRKPSFLCQTLAASCKNAGRRSWKSLWRK